VKAWDRLFAQKSREFIDVCENLESYDAVLTV